MLFYFSVFFVIEDISVFDYIIKFINRYLRMGCGHSAALGSSPDGRKNLMEQQRTLKSMEKDLVSLN